MGLWDVNTKKWKTLFIARQWLSYAGMNEYVWNDAKWHVSYSWECYYNLYWIENNTGIWAEYMPKDVYVILGVTTGQYVTNPDWLNILLWRIWSWN